MSDYPHRIRLRGPWECEPLLRFTPAAGGAVQESTDELPPKVRSAPPFDPRALFGADFHGRVRYRRHFHAPIALIPSEELWLVVEGAEGAVAVWLNDEPLGEFVGGPQPWHGDITRRLQTQNELCLDVDTPGPAAASGTEPPPFREVRLEVRLATGTHGHGATQ